MSTEDLRISDGTTEVALFSGIDGVYLNAWRPAITQPKGGGTYMASALSDGRRLADRRLDNVVETFDLKVRAADQDALAQTMQDLRRLLESAVQYWTTSWQDTPVYLVAQGSCETEARYAVIHNWSTPSDENPFAQPYLQPRGAAVANDWTLSVERGHWTENPPGTDQCVQVSGTQVGTTYSTGIYRPTQSTDDCYIDSDLFTINLAGAALLIGQVPNRYDAGIRFRSVAVPQGSVISNAFMRFVSTSNQAGYFRTYIEGEDDSTPAAYSTWWDYIFRPTTGVIHTPQWPAWTTGTTYDTSDCSVPVQAIINRGDWASGNNLALQINASGSSTLREPASWDNVTYNEPELHVTWEASTSTFGRSATCDDEVYVANKHNISQITTIFVDDGGAFGGNMIGAAVPFNLLPAVPVVNDAIYFGVNTGGPNTGPFCSLVFDIGTAVTDTTITWEYDNGGGWGAAAALTTQDNTNGFNTTGVNSVHWEQPNDWDETSVVNGVTGYWVRANVSAIGGAPATATQQNRDVYSILWPRIQIDDAQVGGDLPALARVHLKNHSHNNNYPSDDLDTYRVVCGLRSQARGADFTAYLNISDEQNPTGLTVTRHATETNAFVADDTTPTGRVLVDNTTTADAWYDLVTFTFQPALADDFYGTYHAFLRADQDSGAVGDIGYRLKVFYGDTDVVVSDTVYFATLNAWQVLDLGTFSYPGAPIMTDDLSESSGFIIQRYATSTTPTAELYDLIIIPTDEWAGDFSARSEETNDSIQLTNYLDVDSLQPRHNIRALVRQETSDYVRTRWLSVSNGPAVLQPNADQDLWFFTMELAADDSDELRAPPYHGFSVQLFRNQRYFGYRGAR